MFQWYQVGVISILLNSSLDLVDGFKLGFKCLQLVVGDRYQFRIFSYIIKLYLEDSSRDLLVILLSFESIFFPSHFFMYYGFNGHIDKNCIFQEHKIINHRVHVLSQKYTSLEF